MADSSQLLAELKMLHPKLIDLSLGRIERLLAKLGQPHAKLPAVVHVAGTNGKGSTTAFLRAMLEAAGARVHVYTSPHLVRFHERIVLADGPGRSAPIPEAALVDVLTRTQAANGGDDITQFEITTAAAFLAFSEVPADVLLLEVGLGGRLDATNVVARPALSIITPVSMDHADKLGNSLADIAREKAGILKPGVRAVTSQQPAEALDVIEARAAQVGAPLSIWGRDFIAFKQSGRLVFQAGEQLMDLAVPSLLGPHQIINGGTAVAAALQLPGLRLDERAIEAGLVATHWPARMQRLDTGPLPSLLSPGSELWLDGGHNPAAGEVLAQTLADLEDRSPRPLHLVVGMMGLKDASGFLRPFAGLARSVSCVPIPRANEAPYTPEALVQAACAVGLPAHASPSVAAALSALRAVDEAPMRVLVTGSLYLAGHVLAIQQGVEQQAN
ncbi:MAG: folylpolyglutamate synthase/dihydrofolate synthase family protein [Hyphomicrobiaceae bacterium]|nr:folylpolyglutamate synthase/dihydrofolate synthase family protein [Hyphomicrobiaceae bacterium]